ncbi:MAG: acetyl-CoA carboxylase carboxyl transferase subunit beta [Phycisphaerae bacterium]|nr:acetyl-CoA carboxylase carboxyl transferase subunit beta [Phycisphaerae bacterium]|tara:strand:+ start:17011 stop:17862 length:852 start_codon:yes stop_codon:yes gene_type:complete
MTKQETTQQFADEATSPARKRSIREGLWIRCDACSAILFRRSVENNLEVCPECQKHFRVPAEQRIKQLVDPETFESFDDNLSPQDPLSFVDLKSYEDRLVAAQKKTKKNDAIQTGYAFIKGRKVVLGVMNFAFLGGSMGSVVGEKIRRAIERAADQDLPLIIVATSGGARMMESGLSLMQMAKTSAALARFDDMGGLFISVLTDPTTGGVTASFAMLGDVILAEPKALIGFAGPRVIQQTIKQDLPDGFQRSEFLLECGFVDCVVPRSELRSEISSLIDYAGK